MKAPPQFLRIFLVEDSLPEERLIAEMLQDYGDGQLILSKAFGCLRDALEGLETEEAVDAVLLDLTLPDSCGIETYHALARVAQRVPVVVLSDEDNEELAIQAIQNGAQDYLPKYELTGQGLVRSIHFAVARKRMDMALLAHLEEQERRVNERTRALMDANQRLSEVLNQWSTTQAQAIHEERLHTIKLISNGIAHDFNNALSPILAHSELLLRKPEALGDESGIKKALTKIHESAEHCAEIVMRLRECYRSHGELASLELLDLREVVQEAICLTELCWKDQAQARGCQITVKTQFSEAVKILGSKSALRQMFTDIILNAVDAIPVNGAICASVSPSRDGVSVKIADSGVGMSPEVAAKCMEPFFTTKDGKGIGLGLGVVSGIAQRHQAEIAIESTEGEGTTVTVQFHAPPPEPSLSKPDPSETELIPPQTLTGLRILAVEDEPNIREVLAVYLTEDGHRVAMAADGAAALAMFVRGRFDLLLTDYSMPNMNGDHLAAAIRGIDPEIRIALLTGFGSSLPQRAPLRLEVDAIISKPFTFDSLRQGIAEAMEGRK